MYLLKHSRPELSNIIRELFKCLSGPSEKNKKELMRVLKWIIDNPDIGLRIKPKIELNDKGEMIWKLVGISDITWGSIPDNGKSVTVWKSKNKTVCIEQF